MSPKPFLAAACTLLLAALLGDLAFVLVAPADAPPPAPRVTHAEPASLTATLTQPNGCCGERDAARTLVAERTDAPRPLPADAECIAITVVDGQTKAPVAGAVVRWFDETAWPFLDEHGIGRTEASLLRDDPEQLADRAGWRTSADALGRARITIASDTTILAERDGRHGRLAVRARSVAPAGGHTIEIEIDRALRVLVLDADDHPCGGVLVSLAIADDPRTSARLARTREADGVATFAHLQLVERPSSSAEWSAEPIVLGLPRSESSVGFSIDAPPTEPLVLRLPPCGSVRARAEFRDNPVPGIREITFWHQQGYVAERMSVAVGADGWARVRHVPLDVELEAIAYWLGAAKFRGPRQPGETVDVIVAPDPARVTWTGRLLAQDRTPVADQSISVRIERERCRPTLQAMCTDASGRFVIGLLRHDADELAARISFDWRPRGELTMRAELAPRMLRSGIEDLGDVMPATPPLIAAGRITGVDGATRDEVALAIERHAPSACAGDSWEGVGAALLERGPAGTFTIRGTIAPGHFRLVVRGDVQRVEPIEFPLGCSDLVIDLERGHDLAAGVLLPRGVPPEQMRVELVPPPSARIAPLRRERLAQFPEPQQGERHDVQWTAIAAGTYSLELWPWAATQPVLRIPDVQVPAPPGGDPRLADIDLRSLVCATTVQLVAADGEPLATGDGAVFPNARPGAGPWLGYEVKAAAATLVLPAGPCDLLVCCEGHRPQRVRGAAGEQFAVRMDPWPRVTIAFDGMPPLPDGVSADVFATPVVPIDGTYETPSYSRALDSLFGPRHNRCTIENGEGTLSLGDGAHRLGVRVARGDLDHRLAVGEPREVFATNTAIVVRIPPDEWQRTIDAVTARPK